MSALVAGTATLGNSPFTGILQRGSVDNSTARALRSRSDCCVVFPKNPSGLGSRLGFPRKVGSEDCVVDGRRLVGGGGSLWTPGWVCWVEDDVWTLWWVR